MFSVDNPLKVFEGFGGVGAFSMALARIGVPYQLTGFSEIDDKTALVYSVLHNVDISYNKGDITKIDFTQLPDFDVYFHGSPCQTFSNLGSNAGGDEFSGTLSSLMWYSVNLINIKRPKFVVWENVRGVLSYLHKDNFDKYIDTLTELGYNSYYSVLDAQDFGIPQSRPRVFCVSIHESVEDNDYVFPQKQDLRLTLHDLLESNVEEKYYLKENEIKSQLTDFRLSHRLAAVDPEVALCLLTAGNGTVVTTDGRLRNLTPLECWRLMAFYDVDFIKACDCLIGSYKNINLDGIMYKMAGNSIVVDVAVEVLRQLFYGRYK